MAPGIESGPTLCYTSGARPDRVAVPPRILAKLPPGAVWVDALDYADLQFARPRPSDSLMSDGLRQVMLPGGGRN